MGAKGRGDDRVRWKGVPEYLVNGVMSLYKGCKTAFSVDGELSSSLLSRGEARV